MWMVKKKEEKEKGKFFLGETMKVPIYNAIQAPQNHDHRGTPQAVSHNICAPLF